MGPGPAHPLLSGSWSPEWEVIDFQLLQATPSVALARQPSGTNRALEGRRWYPNLGEEEDGSPLRAPYSQGRRLQVGALCSRPPSWAASQGLARTPGGLWCPGLGVPRVTPCNQV